VFWGTAGGLQVTFNGQPLTFLTTGSTANYIIYTADISAYAGQTGQLLFADPYYTNTQGGPASIDNIQFSSSSVPEPSAFALGALGTLLLGFRRWRNF
jgi:PEP-CTERM motif